jgi:hypothetical protein
MRARCATACGLRRAPRARYLLQFSSLLLLQFQRRIRTHLAHCYLRSSMYQSRCNNRATYYCDITLVLAACRRVAAGHQPRLAGLVRRVPQGAGPADHPTAFGGRAEDAFHVVCPSLPGFAFSAKPAEPGWGVDRIAAAWAVLMDRLGYARYGAQGGDWGSALTTRSVRSTPAISPASTSRWRRPAGRRWTASRLPRSSGHWRA